LVLPIFGWFSAESVPGDRELLLGGFWITGPQEIVKGVLKDIFVSVFEYGWSRNVALYLSWGRNMPVVWRQPCSPACEGGVGGSLAGFKRELPIGKAEAVSSLEIQWTMVLGSSYLGQPSQKSSITILSPLSQVSQHTSDDVLFVNQANGFQPFVKILDSCLDPSKIRDQKLRYYKTISSINRLQLQGPGFVKLSSAL
jgi:hypothetical protein